MRGGGGTANQAAANIFSKGGFSSTLSNLKGMVWNQDAWNQYPWTTGGVIAGGIEGVASSPAAGAAGFSLATRGLISNAGTWTGAIQGAAGGALIGNQIGGPLGAAAGASFGFEIGSDGQSQLAQAMAKALQIRGRPKRMSPGAAVAAARPSQAVPGKRAPAEVTGDAQPMRPSGGSTPAANAMGILHAAAVRFGVQATVIGNARRTAAIIQAQQPAIMVVPANVA